MGLLIITPIVGLCVHSMFCCILVCVLSRFSIILMGERKMAVLLWFVFLVSCKCYVALPHGAVGWSAVFDCGIS